MEVKIDYKFDTKGFEEAVQDQLVDKASSQLVDKITSQTVGATVDRVLERVNGMLDDFLERPVIITDRYGDKKAEFESVTEMIKERFDNLMDEKVDHGVSRLEYMVDKRIRNLLNHAIDKLLDNVERKVEREVRDRLTKEVARRMGGTLAAVVDIDALLEKK